MQDLPHYWLNIFKKNIKQEKRTLYHTGIMGAFSS